MDDIDLHRYNCGCEFCKNKREQEGTNNEAS